MSLKAQDLFAALSGAVPRPTAEAPRDARGLYGLVDHGGALRYIGSTRATRQSLHEWIQLRHRTGPGGMGHLHAQIYNTGRMWRDPGDRAAGGDGALALSLRAAFVTDHCRAVWLPLPDTADIARIEVEVLALAPAAALAWTRQGVQACDEPVDQVEATLHRLGWRAQEREALDRQRARFRASLPGATPVPSRVPPFPRGPFRFVALDVETANHDRGSICQIGVACVRPDATIETWVTLVDPQVDRWAFTWLHGIGARTVRGAPTFAEVLPVLAAALEGLIVYQHSGFDRGAVTAACASRGLPVPSWDWHDSVRVARAAWPELKGNGGHGLASLKQYLGLVFDHHDAGEDARAAAEVVLRAEGVLPVAPAPASASARDRTPGRGAAGFPLTEDTGRRPPQGHRR